MPVLLKLYPVVRETGGDKNLVENKNFATQNLVEEKIQFAVAAAAADMKITKSPPAVIIKITKPQLCTDFYLASTKQFPRKTVYKLLQVC